VALTPSTAIAVVAIQGTAAAMTASDTRLMRNSRAAERSAQKRRAGAGVAVAGGALSMGDTVLPRTAARGEPPGPERA